MNRRQFLVALSGIGALGFGGLAARGAAAGGREAAIAAIIRHHLGADLADSSEAYRFAADYAPGNTIPARVRALVETRLYFWRPLRMAWARARIEQFDALDRRIVTDFLLSSSYRQDDGGPLRYIRFDTHRVCNPYARLL